VRNATDLQRFLDAIRRLLDYFFGELGGRPTTPTRYATWRWQKTTALTAWRR